MRLEARCFPDSSVQEALNVVESHRASFRQPLVTANNGLRSFVRTLGIDGKISQRLKRMMTILDKVCREPTLALNNMQDIGGCRVVVPTRDDVWRLSEHIQKRKTPIRVSDYITTPRQSGYRGVHVIVDYGRNGLVRPIEIQIRTEVMHEWAVTVEDLSGNQGTNYKRDGTDPMQLFLECYARMLECIELGRVPSAELNSEYKRLLDNAFGEVGRK